MAEYAASIDIIAPAEIVFAHLVTPERMVRWMGQRADLHAVAGGTFAVDINGTLVRGEYLEVEPPHRVVVSWGMIGIPELPPGASRVEFTLTPIESGTRLKLLHTGLPASRGRSHGLGWANYLRRLELTASGRDPGPDNWRAAASA